MDYKTYKGEYEDGNFEIETAANDSEAFNLLEENEAEHGTLYNIFEIDEEYNEIRTVL